MTNFDAVIAQVCALDRVLWEQHAERVMDVVALIEQERAQIGEFFKGTRNENVKTYLAALAECSSLLDRGYGMLGTITHGLSDAMLNSLGTLE